MQSDKIYKLLITIAVIFLAGFVMFYKLGSSGIHIWDEAIYANNALEIAINGDWFVMKVDGVSNLYNTKPPLMVWLQAIAIKIWGAHTWSLRLPAALAGISVVFSLLIFSRRSLGDLRIGWLAALILCSSIGYVRYHVTRSGDLDSLLTLFVVGLSLLFFHFLLHQTNKKHRWFLAMGVFVMLAYMTKSTAALIPLPGLLIGSFYKGRIFDILKSPSFYISALISILVILGYYAYRESLGSGYCTKVWHSEFLRFTDNIMPWHTQPPSFYVKKLFAESYFSPFAYLLPLIPSLFFLPAKNKAINSFDPKHFTFLIAAFIVSFIAIVSYPSTKIGWYLAPLYPILSLGVAFILVHFMDYLDPKIKGPLKGSSIGLILIAILILVFPYRGVVKQINNTAPRAPQEYAYTGLSEIQKRNPEIKDFDLIMIKDKKRHLDQARFYARAMSHYQNYKLNLISEIEKIDTSRNFFICHERDKKHLSALHTKEIDLGHCSLYLIAD